MLIVLNNFVGVVMKKILLLLSMSLFATEVVAQSNDSSTELAIDIGGALRFNYNYSSWKQQQKTRGGDFGFEVFLIKLDAEYGKLEMHLDQRFYAESSGGAFLKYGWFQYNLNKHSHFKIGLIPAYFGVQQFNSHSWFFQLPFYLGYEDDHDMGVSYNFEHKKMKLAIGFYKNAEELDFSDNNPISTSRYGYDFSGRNREINQINIRFNYKTGNTVKQKIGGSVQYGGIWNIDTREVGNQKSLGLHYELDYKRWNLKSMFLAYHHTPKNSIGESRDQIEMVAYNFPYNIAAKASIYSMGIAYTLPIKKSLLKSIQFYNDYSYMDKAIDSWEDTQMNVLGTLFSLKHLYIYVDYASGLHHPWLGSQTTNAFTTGDAANSWESRFNINLGFYY